MPDPPSDHLRNRPRQARSAARVELLLDVAAEVFEEVGYDAATTNLVASRADVPVGTLYRWFPDKAALAEGLTDRYLANLLSLVEELLAGLHPAERISEFLRRVLQRLVDETANQRALPALLVSAMVPGGRSVAGTRLRQGLEAHARDLLVLRIPGLPDEVRDRTAEVVVTQVHLVLAAVADDDAEHRRAMIAEYGDVLVAYLEAKFPVAGHPAWTDPDVAVQPVVAAADRASRLAADEGGTRQTADTPRHANEPGR